MRVTVIFTLCFLLFGCANLSKKDAEKEIEPEIILDERIAWESHDSRPEWTYIDPYKEEGNLFFVGMSDKLATEKDSRDSALNAAISNVVKYIGASVYIEIIKIITDSGLSSEIIDPYVIQKSVESQISQAAARRVKSSEWYIQKWEMVYTRHVETYYLIWSLAFVPEEEINEAIKEQKENLKNITSIANSIRDNLLYADKLLSDATYEMNIYPEQAYKNFHKAKEFAYQAQLLAKNYPELQSLYIKAESLVKKIMSVQGAKRSFDVAMEAVKNGELKAAVLGFFNVLEILKDKEVSSEINTQALLTNSQRALSNLALGLTTEKSGDYQTAHFGEELKEPFKVFVYYKWEDKRFPAVDIPVNFELIEGKGRIKKEIFTDESGMTIAKVTEVTSSGVVEAKVELSSHFPGWEVRPLIEQFHFIISDRFTLHIEPGINIPFGEGSDYYSLGGNLDLSGKYKLSKHFPLYLKGEIGYNFNPIRDASSIKQSFSFLFWQLGVGIYFKITPWLQMEGYGSGGYYLGFLNEGGSLAGGNPLFSTGGGFYFSITPKVILFLGASYKKFFGLWNVVDISSGITFHFQTRKKHN